MATATWEVGSTASSMAWAFGLHEADPTESRNVKENGSMGNATDGSLQEKSSTKPSLQAVTNHTLAALQSADSSHERK